MELREIGHHDRTAAACDGDERDAAAKDLLDGARLGPSTHRSPTRVEDRDDRHIVEIAALSSTARKPPTRLKPARS